MARPERHEEPLQSIQADLNYLVDTGNKPVTYSDALGGNKNTGHTGRYETHKVTIQNGRTLIDRFSLDREGLIFIAHETKVRDFYDENEVKSVYYREIEQLVKDVTGANRVVVFDH